MSPDRDTFRFGVFEADTRTGELRKSGMRIKLQEKPFQFLIALLERPGELVTREDLRQKLWSSDTYVEFDRSLNIAVRKLRSALNDTADVPRYVETLRGRGYRFIGQLDPTNLRPPAATGAAEVPSHSEGALPGTSARRSSVVPWPLTAGSLALEKDPAARHQSTAEMVPDLEGLKGDGDSGSARPGAGVVLAASHPDAARAATGRSERAPLVHLKTGAWTAFAIVAAVAALSLLIGLGAHALNESRERARQNDGSSQLEMVRLTADGKSGSVAAISPDGRYVAHVFDDKGQQSLWLRQTATASDIEIMPPDTVDYDGLTFSRDGNYIYCTLTDKDHPPYHSLYRIPALGGLPKEKLLSEVDGPAALSPDGKLLAIGRSFLAVGAQSQETLLLVANQDGTGARVVARHTAPEVLSWRGEGWSPDGEAIAYCVIRHEGRGRAWVAAVSPQGGPERALSSPSWQVCQSAAWLPGTSEIVTTATTEVAFWASAGYQLWKTLYPGGLVTRITNDLNTYYGMSLTSDGSTVVTVQYQIASSIWLVSEGQIEPQQITTSGAAQDGLLGVAWTPDGRFVFSSVRSGTPQLWIASSDGSYPKQLTQRDVMNAYPAVSPDGRTVFFGSGVWGGDSVWKVHIDGSNSEQLAGETFSRAPDISPDGTWMVFSAEPAGQQVVRRLDLQSHQATDLAVGSNPRVSPDGKMIAFQYHDESLKKTRIAVIAPGGGPRLATLDFPWDRKMRGAGQIQWAPDGHALTYYDTKDGVSNIWSQPLDGSAPRQLTHFTSDRIFSFAWSRDGKSLAVSRGTVNGDVVLIRNLH